MTTAEQVGRGAALRALLAQNGGGTAGLADIEVRPDRVAGLHRHGSRPYRILLLGGGVLEGRGLQSHEQGLPGQVAAQLAGRSGRGVDLDVIVESDPTSPQALQGLHGLRLLRYDAVVVVLGDHYATSGVRPGAWETMIVGLAKVLLAETAGTAPIFVYDAAMLAPAFPAARRMRAAAELGSQLAEITARACALTGRIRFRELAAPLQDRELGSRFAAATYLDWGDEIVSHLYPRLVQLDGWLGADTPRAYRGRADDERFRQRALESLRLGPGRDALLDAVVRQARTTFRAGAAAITILDGPEMWQKATTGAEQLRMPREATICDLAIESDDLTVVNDTRSDPRLAGHWLAGSTSPVRFYAGYPIRTWDGYRIGMLCITDPEPRATRPSELGELRDLAGRIEQALWETALRPSR